MTAREQHIHIRRLLILAYALTIPTIFYWVAVAISVFMHNHKYVDVLLAPGIVSRILLTFVLPLISFTIAVICRVNLRQRAIAQNLWHRETQEMKVNQGLINWSVILIAVMIISLINN